MHAVWKMATLFPTNTQQHHHHRHHEIGKDQPLLSYDIIPIRDKRRIRKRSGEETNQPEPNVHLIKKREVASSLHAPLDAANYDLADYFIPPKDDSKTPSHAAQSHFVRDLREKYVFIVKLHFWKAWITNN